FRVDRPDVALKAASHDVFHHDPADRALARRSAEDGERPRVDSEFQIAYRHDRTPVSFAFTMTDLSAPCAGSRPADAVAADRRLRPTHQQWKPPASFLGAMPTAIFRDARRAAALNLCRDSGRAGD